LFSFKTTENFKVLAITWSTHHEMNKFIMIACCSWTTLQKVPKRHCIYSTSFKN